MSHYGKSAKKATVSAPLAKARKTDDKKTDEAREMIREAAKESAAKAA